jgi:surfactin family lipopeptide synthetase A
MSQNFLRFRFKYLNLENGENVAELIHDIENKMVHKVYQLNQSPLYDVCYINIKNTSSALIFNAHHIITDAWSMTLLLKELIETYSEISSGQPIPEKESPSLFSDYVKVLSSKRPVENKDGTEYWLNELKGLRPFEFSAKNQMSCQSGFKTSVYRNFLDVPTTMALENQAKQKMVSLFNMLISAYYKIIQKITRQNDLVIRVATANRDRSFINTQDLTGCLADSIPLRIHIEEQDGLVEISQKVKNKLIQSQKFNSISSLEYAGILNARSQSGPAGITPFGMSYLNIDFFVRKGTSEYPVIEPRLALPFTDLSLICLKQNGSLAISWNYSSACFSPESIEELIKLS